MWSEQPWKTLCINNNVSMVWLWYWHVSIPWGRPLSNNCSYKVSNGGQSHYHCADYQGDSRVALKMIIIICCKILRSSTLVMSDILPARGGPERAARPPPAVRRPNAGVNKWKLGRLGWLQITIEAENNDDAGYHDCVEDKKGIDFRVSFMIRIW